DLEGDPSYRPPDNPAGPVKVRFIDPVYISGGLTSYFEIPGTDLPPPPQGFRADNPVTGQPARYFQIQSNVSHALSEIPILVFINKDEFPAGSDTIFHLKEGQWQPLFTFDGAVIAAIDSATDFLFKLKPDLISNLINGAIDLAQFATSELHSYRVAF